MKDEQVYLFFLTHQFSFIIVNSTVVKLLKFKSFAVWNKMLTVKKSSTTLNYSLV